MVTRLTTRTGEFQIEYLSVVGGDVGYNQSLWNRGVLREVDANVDANRVG